MTTFLKIKWYDWRKVKVPLGVFPIAQRAFLRSRGSASRPRPCFSFGITLARRLRYADTERGAGRRYRPRFARVLPKGATRVWRCGAGSDIPTTDLSIYPASLRALW